MDPTCRVSEGWECLPHLPNQRHRSAFPSSAPLAAPILRCFGGLFPLVGHQSESWCGRSHSPQPPEADLHVSLGESSESGRPHLTLSFVLLSILHSCCSSRRFCAADSRLSRLEIALPLQSVCLLGLQ